MSAYDNQYYILASAFVFYYDSALTIPQEMMYLWSSKRNLVNVLVLVLRYTTALGYIPILVVTFASETVAFGDNFHTWFAINCVVACFAPSFSSFFSERMSNIPGIIGIVCQALTSMFLIIRLYAIYDKRRWVLYVSVPFAVLNVVMSSLAFRTAAWEPITTPDDETILSCFVSESFGISLELFKWAYIVTILFDALIFVLAVTKTGKMYLAKRWHGSHPSIASILLRDGTVLYATLAVSNITNFVLYMLFFVGDDASVDEESISFVTSSGINSEMTHALSAVLVSRMIFNLREAGTDVHEATAEWRSRTEQLPMRLGTMPNSRSCNKDGATRRQPEDDFGVDTVTWDGE